VKIAAEGGVRSVCGTFISERYRWNDHGSLSGPVASCTGDCNVFHCVCLDELADLGARRLGLCSSDALASLSMSKCIESFVRQLGLTTFPLHVSK
jgi:hypothetical protein